MGWHSDNEPLFGERGEAKLIVVSVSFGSSAVFKWKFFGFMASPWCLVHLGDASFASHLPCMYKAWVFKMCLLLCRPCGWSIAGALSLLPLGSLLGSTKKLPVRTVVCSVVFVVSSCTC